METPLNSFLEDGSCHRSRVFGTAPADVRLAFIVPAYNESTRLPMLLSGFVDLARGASSSNEWVEVIVVNDGSRRDEAMAMAQQVEQASREVGPGTYSFRVLDLPLNKGKGAALRTGFHEALKDGKFEVVGFLDADGATSPQDALSLARLVSRGPSGPHGVFGMRIKCLGNRVERTWQRHVMGRVFASLVGTLFSIPVYDSQCGAKFFSARSLPLDLLDKCDDNGWLFDLQLVIGLHDRGVELLEVPVPWRDQEGSKVSLFRDTIRMFFQLLRIRRRRHRLQ